MREKHKNEFANKNLCHPIIARMWGFCDSLLSHIWSSVAIFSPALLLKQTYHHVLFSLNLIHFVLTKNQTCFVFGTKEDVEKPTWVLLLFFFFYSLDKKSCNLFPWILVCNLPIILGIFLFRFSLKLSFFPLEKYHLFLFPCGFGWLGLILQFISSHHYAFLSSSVLSFPSDFGDSLILLLLFALFCVCLNQICTCCCRNREGERRRSTKLVSLLLE